jgi:hypothetical protein
MLHGWSLKLTVQLFDLNNFDSFIVVVLPIKYFHVYLPIFLRNFIAYLQVEKYGNSQGRPLPMGQPELSEQLAPPPPIHKNLQKMRSFAVV